MRSKSCNTAPAYKTGRREVSEGKYVEEMSAKGK